MGTDNHYSEARAAVRELLSAADTVRALEAEVTERLLERLRKRARELRGTESSTPRDRTALLVNAYGFAASTLEEIIAEVKREASEGE